MNYLDDQVIPSMDFLSPDDNVRNHQAQRVKEVQGAGDVQT